MSLPIWLSNSHGRLLRPVLIGLIGLCALNRKHLKSKTRTLCKQQIRPSPVSL